MRDVLKGVLKPATVFESDGIRIHDNHYVVEESPARVHMHPRGRSDTGGGGGGGGDRIGAVTSHSESESLSSDPLTPGSSDLASPQDQRSYYNASSQQRTAMHQRVCLYISRHCIITRLHFSQRRCVCVCLTVFRRYHFVSR